MGIDITGFGAVSDLAGTIINKIWPDKSKEEQAQLAAAVSIINGQMAINQAEALNPSVFVSGWRPFIGWVCGGACAWNWIGISCAKVLVAFLHYDIPLEPASLGEMMPVLLGLLGLGALRTVEKFGGVAAK